ncbi:hypothetical protein VP01_91g5 [Puccinia sorghi]|uniref:Uncharacterized protein n=1 Tax=Puccinia sorghi TaxID=27349 RepID=A0A0L6U7B9_9BASI|nr:hypothetical protein VP01_91g5 [Puccinia sorghi]
MAQSSIPGYMFPGCRQALLTLSSQKGLSDVCGLNISYHLVIMTLDWHFWASGRLALSSTGIKTVEICHLLLMTCILLENELQNIYMYIFLYMFFNILLVHQLHSFSFHSASLPGEELIFEIHKKQKYVPHNFLPALLIISLQQLDIHLKSLPSTHPTSRSIQPPPPNMSSKLPQYQLGLNLRMANFWISHLFDLWGFGHINGYGLIGNFIAESSCLGQLSIYKDIPSNAARQPWASAAADCDQILSYFSFAEHSRKARNTGVKPILVGIKSLMYWGCHDLNESCQLDLHYFLGVQNTTHPLWICNPQEVAALVQVGRETNFYYANVGCRSDSYYAEFCFVNFLGVKLQQIRS